MSLGPKAGKEKMNFTLRIFFIVAIVLFLIVILRYLSKNKLNLKYYLVWLVTSAGLLVLTIFPGLVDKIGAIVGIISPVNTVFVFALMFICFCWLVAYPLYRKKIYIKI